MLLVSQNLLNYSMDFPSDVVLRVNMAWVDSLDQLKETLSKSELDYFIDVPSGRLKPPNNRYTIKDILPIIGKYSNVKYLAISNVELPEQVLDSRNITENKLIIVPKIETIKGVDNLTEIIDTLGSKKYIMLDHDDLFTDVSKRGFSSEIFISKVNELVKICKSNSVTLLRARGIIFSDEI